MSGDPTFRVDGVSYGAPAGSGVVEVASGVFTDPARSMATILADAPAANRAALFAWTQITAADASWTRTPGVGVGAVTSVVGGLLHTELAGVATDDLTFGFVGPRQTYELVVPDAAQWSVAARLTFSGLDANGRVSLGVRRAAAQILGVTVRDTGDVEVFADAGAPSATVVAGFASGDWLRITRRGGALEVYSGAGASLAAVTWTWRGSVAIPAGQLPLTLTVSLGQYTAPPAAPPLVSDVGPLYWRSGL